MVQNALSVPLDYAPHATSVARTRAVEFVRPWASDDFRAELSLLASELVTNAVIHGLPDICLHVCAVDALRVRLEVFDGSPVLPKLRAPTEQETSGRGLRIIDAIAIAWGATPLHNGKVVWCELADRGV